MEQHPRTEWVELTKRTLQRSLDFARQGLTNVEYLQFLQSEMSLVLKNMLRTERHPKHPGEAAEIKCSDPKCPCHRGINEKAK